MPVAPNPVVPTRRTQVERREATRAALLAAALDQLVAEGLGGFTTTEVCRRSGLSQGALFKHFATKDLLLAAVAEHLFDELRTEFEREFTALGPGDRSTRAGVELLWRQMFDPRLAAPRRVAELASICRLRRSLRRRSTVRGDPYQSPLRKGSAYQSVRVRGWPLRASSSGLEKSI